MAKEKAKGSYFLYDCSDAYLVGNEYGYSSYDEAEAAALEVIKTLEVDNSIDILHQVSTVTLKPVVTKADTPATR